MFVSKKWIVIEDENFTDEDVKNAKAQFKDLTKARILMDRHMILKDPSFFEKLCSAFPGVDVFIKVDDVEYDVNYNASQVFVGEELTRLIENNSIISRKGGKLYLSGYIYGDDPKGRENKIPFQRVVQANYRMDNWVEKINSATVDGKPLSPFEKYLYAYQIVTQFKYTEDQIFEARDISRILSSKFIVCAGYSSILSELCRRVGIVCKRQYIHVDDTGSKEMDDAWANHEECILQLKDPKYGIDGFFIADPTLDSFDSAIDEGTSITHALINLDDHDKLYNGKEHILVDKFLDNSNFYFLRDAKEIPYRKTFRESETCLKDVSNALKSSQFDMALSEHFMKVLRNPPVANSNFAFDDKMKNAEKKLIDEYSNDLSLLTKLFIRNFSLEGYDDEPDAILTERFLSKSLSAYFKKNNLTRNRETFDELINKMIEIAKTDEKITEDHELMSLLADYNDYCVVLETDAQNKFKSILSEHFENTPLYDDYEHAMKNVYIASGQEEEEAEKNAKFMMNASVYVADAFGWGTKNTENPFAVEAKITQPVKAIQRRQLEKFAKRVGVSVQKLEKMVEEQDIEGLEKLGLKIVSTNLANPNASTDNSEKNAKANCSQNIFLERI